ncbi:MAG: AraC family transcriptional regulator [Gemmatimonadales bacterium]
MDATLEAGEYFGILAETRVAGKVALTNSAYSPGAVVPAHAHARPYFCYVTAGDFRETGAGASYAAARGSLVFHPATESHSDLFGENGASCFNIEIDAHFDADCEPGPVTGRAVRYAAELSREMASWDAASGLVAEGIAAALVARVACDRRRVAGAEVSSSRAPVDFSRAVEQLRADPCTSPSLEELAADAGLSVRAFALAFRRNVGLGVGAFVRAERVERAKRALAESRRPVSTIAAELGFADQAHLTRVFRDATGWTPAAFRRMSVG